MSDTLLPPGSKPDPAKPATPVLVSSSPANQSTAAASGGAAAAIVVILMWVFGLFHVTVPAEVASAFVFVIGAGVHWLVIKYGLTSTP